MNFSTPLAAIAAATIGLAAFGAAHADDRQPMPHDTPKAYLQECGTCHLAYPPGLLSARSWQRIMGGLERHYGSDASLDAATLKTLDDWLQARAGTSRRLGADPPQDRVTRADWFLREHRKVDAAVWAHASVKSPANCPACHAGAALGDFDDDRLRMPAGLDARLRRAWRD